MTDADRIRNVLALVIGTLEQAARAVESGDASAAEASLSAAQRQIDGARLLVARGERWETRVQDEILRRRPA